MLLKWTTPEVTPGPYKTPAAPLTTSTEARSKLDSPCWKLKKVPAAGVIKPLLSLITYVDVPKVPDPALISRFRELAVCCCIWTPGTDTRTLVGSATCGEFSICLEEITLTEAGASVTFWARLEAEITTSSRFCPADNITLISWLAEVTSTRSALYPT